jgi:endoglucanase
MKKSAEFLFLHRNQNHKTMDTNHFSRRNFIRTSGMAAAAIGLTGPAAFGYQSASAANPIPRWRGFNLLDYFSPLHGGGGNKSKEDDFKWMKDWGFDFVRIPMAYPSYLKFDRSKNITPEEVYQFDEEILDKIEELVDTAHKYNLHVSLNLHRAPGYCINAGFYEPYVLWTDDKALEAFCFHWEMWAKKFKNVSRDKISFDLVNEPAMRNDPNDQHSPLVPVPGELYRKVAKAAAEAIRSANPNHLVIADGNDVGNKVINEIIDLDIAQSCRGYYPGEISHYQAPWAFKYPEKNPIPVWPGKIGDREFSRADLERLYAPWIELTKKGVGVHCGECGCWKNTPHNVFLAWFEDVIDVLTDAGIGYSLWNFRGDFGILDSGRIDVEYENWHGHKLDRKLLSLLQKY